MTAAVEVAGRRLFKHPATEHAAGQVARMSLKTDRDGRLAAGQRRGDLIRHVDKLTRLFAFQSLGRDPGLVDKDVEFALDAVTAPVCADECHRLIGQNFHPIAEPPALIGVSPCAAGERPCHGSFTLLLVLPFGIGLTDDH